MRNEKGEITIKSIWKWLRSDKGKRYSFFIFYFFFFVFLFLFISIPNNEVVDNKNNNIKEEQKLPFNLKKIKNNNYKFTYTINYNNNILEYTGQKDGSLITLTNEIDKYTYNYVNNELKEEIKDSPILIDFLDIYKIENMIINSTIIEETKLIATDELLYTYNIETSKLFDVLLYDSLIINNSSNNIIIKNNSLKEVVEIKLDLLNYMKELKKEEFDNYEIIIKYEVSHE